MIKLLRRVFTKPVPRTFDLWEEVPAPKDNRCPACNNNTFCAGPSGPGSQNFECANCGSRWNIPSYAGFSWQYIGRRDER